ncbi:MAG: hypothetical protein AAF385_14350 [Pseudomonadota bacterium]
MKIPVFISLMFLLIAAPTVAQESPKITMQTFSVVTSFALPPWSSEDDLVETSEISRQQGPSSAGHDIFIWETIPKGESFENWSKLYAISAEYPLNGDLENYANVQASRFNDACERSVVQFSRTTPDNVKLFVVHCGSYKARPEIGEIAIINMQLQDETLVKNYFHVRVPKFNLDNAAEFPLGADEILKMFLSVSALRLTGVSSD